MIGEADRAACGKAAFVDGMQWTKGAIGAPEINFDHVLTGGCGKREAKAGAGQKEGKHEAQQEQNAGHRR